MFWSKSANANALGTLTLEHLGTLLAVCKRLLKSQLKLTAPGKITFANVLVQVSFTVLEHKKLC